MDPSLVLSCIFLVNVFTSLGSNFRISLFQIFFIRLTVNTSHMMLPYATTAMIFLCQNSRGGNSVIAMCLEEQNCLIATVAGWFYLFLKSQPARSCFFTWTFLQDSRSAVTVIAML